MAGEREDGVPPPPTNPPDTRILDERIDARIDARGIGGGSGGSGLEPRLAKVEAAVEHIERDITSINEELRTLRNNARSDFRLLFGAIITVAIGLASLMAKGFHWIG